MGGQSTSSHIRTGVGANRPGRLWGAQGVIVPIPLEAFRIGIRRRGGYPQQPWSQIALPEGCSGVLELPRTRVAPSLGVNSMRATRNRPHPAFLATSWRRRTSAVSLLALFVLVASAPASALDFSVGVSLDFPTGTNPRSVAIGDVNGDGQPDLAVANGGSNTVSVLLGNGTGGFGAKTDFPTGTAPYSVAIGDLSGDGKPDLAVANSSDHTVSVLLGDGTGGFGAKTDFATGDGPISRGDRGRQRGRPARPGGGELQLQHGVGAAGQRRRRVRGEDRLRDRDEPPLGGDRGRERRRQARPGGGELQHATRCRCCWATAPAGSGPRPTSRPGRIPTRWRSGT